MIDAYEIGIQLLLQEDVTAGLAVINRGLAEVDRAIAATSANLAGLVREAETATKAVAAAAGGRRDLATAASQDTSGSGEQAVRSQPGQEVVGPPAAISGEKAAAPETKAAEPQALVGPTASQSSDEQRSSPQQAQREQNLPSSAPVRSTADTVAVEGQRAALPQTQQETPLPVAPTQVAPRVPASTELASAPVKAAATTSEEPRRSVTPPGAQVALTASVGRAQRSETAAAQPKRARLEANSELATRRERPIAPWSGVDHLGTQPETARVYDRAAAPQKVDRSQIEAPGGTVMLDGRLVGQWLSDHMAREASRPPGGTSFFDPRQTPAWNISGAL